MLSQKLFRWVNKVALFAIVFASLAPSVSHAIAAQQGINSFAQEICSSDGKKITIQVVTTKGQQLQTGLDTTPDANPVTITLHLNHCPFCHAGITDIVMPSRNPAFELYLAHQIDQQHFEYQPPVVPTIIQSAHLSRAPPSISL
jgi:hypothetical protein